jgi:hypothetical protein
MGDVGLARPTLLLAVSFLCNYKRTLNDREIGLWVIELGDSKDFS